MALKRFFNLLLSLFGKRKTIKLGFYGPVNAGKTSLANRISKDFTGEELGVVSKIPHETREIQIKEKVKIKNFRRQNFPGRADALAGLGIKKDVNDNDKKQEVKDG